MELDSVRGGLVPVVAGMAILLVVERYVPFHVAAPLFVRRTWPSVRWRWWRVLWGLSGCALIVYTGVRATWSDLSVWVLLVMWGCGTSLTILSLVPWQHWKQWWDALRESWYREPATYGVMVVLFACGLAVRVIDLEHVPNIVAGDEAQFAFEAVSLRDQLDWIYNPFHMGIWHHPRLVHTLMVASIELLGQSVAAARLPWAVLGAFNIPAVYLLGRWLLGDTVGWLAAIILTTLPLHVHFSRIAMDMTGDTFFITLALAFLARALREHTVVDAALAGLFLGLSQFFYFAGRIAAPIMIMYVLFYIGRDWRMVWARRWVLVIAAFIACGVVFPNLYAVYEDRERSISPRLSHVSIWETGDLDAAQERGDLDGYIVNQVQRGLLAYVHFHDESDTYGRYNPVLGWYAGAPFLMGVVVLLKTWRSPQSSVLLAWIAGTALLGYAGSGGYNSCWHYMVCPSRGEICSHDSAEYRSRSWHISICVDSPVVSAKLRGHAGAGKSGLLQHGLSTTDGKAPLWRKNTGA